MKGWMVCCLFCVAISGFPQSHNFWTPATTTAYAAADKFSRQTLALEKLRATLSGVDIRGSQSRTKTPVISFPAPSGKIQSFVITEAPVLHPALALKFPDIHSYSGQGIEDSTANIRFSLSEDGVHAVVLSSQHDTYYIEPSEDAYHYTIIAREKEARTTFACMTESGEVDTTDWEEKAQATGRTNDKRLRKYRLALSCTAEYGNLFAGTTGTVAQKKARILAQMNATITRVNAVYERDLAITLEVVPNNDLLIYFGNPASDPWSGEFNIASQNLLDEKIGNDGYDIGHNFNTSGGGNAGCIGCVCTPGIKGSGYTGSANPRGDLFALDYVAHEIGHQFGAYHVQSNAKCISGNGRSEVEPGSGSTIMSYAGICSPNVQSKVDDYFAYVSIRDISAYIQKGGAAACAETINLSNSPPVANAGPDYVIPKSTPFVLTGSGSDPDGDILTYTWEQNDPQSRSSATNAIPLASKTTGPLFRSRKGTTSPKRFFPSVSDVAANNIAPTWEVIPSVARTMTFALTVRDNKAGGGQNSDDLMKVTVTTSAGPFTVNYPNGAEQWVGGEARVMKWNVSRTNLAPVNCSAVNVLLSTDGGFTFPITLASGTPNDGSQSITLPDIVSNRCRIKVEAKGNIFYDISDQNFSIGVSTTCQPATPGIPAVSDLTHRSASVGWNHVPGASYDFQYRKQGMATWTTIATGTSNVFLASLSAETRYEARVRSKCGTKLSSFSAVRVFTTNSAANACTNLELVLSFDQNPQETSWIVRNANNVNVAVGGPYESSSAFSRRVMSLCLAPGCYTLVMRDKAGNGMCCSSGNGAFTLRRKDGVVLASGSSFKAYSDNPFCLEANEVAREEVAAVEDIVNESRISCYPNPVDDVLSISSETEIRSMILHTIDGVQLWQHEGDTREVDMSQLSQGLYILRIETLEGVSNHRIMRR